MSLYDGQTCLHCGASCGMRKYATEDMPMPLEGDCEHYTPKGAMWVKDERRENGDPELPELSLAVR